MNHFANMERIKQRFRTLSNGRFDIVYRALCETRDVTKWGEPLNEDAVAECIKKIVSETPRKRPPAPPHP